MPEGDNRYTGREDDGTGLMYYRARYYNPRLSRFISEDPIGLAGGSNLYGYVGGGPVRWRDALGLAMGDYPPNPPGYDPTTWGHGTHPGGGRDFTVDPKSGDKWTVHPEDKGHWRHWDIHSPSGKKKVTWPKQCKKPWPGQNQPPYGEQSGTDPSGDDPSWESPETPQDTPSKYVPVPSLPWWAPLLIPGLGVILSQ